ncbi:MAG: hypothetical protein JWM59_1524 [Verrucomicrobiales bacterium]|nr:hypothetical protein [Verrucomicrobiales bacterium]
MRPLQQALGLFLAGLLPVTQAAPLRSAPTVSLPSGDRPVASPSLPAGTALPAREPAPSSEVTVNETIPETQGPGGALKFSPVPTVQEIFRARLFEEPLVAVGAAAPAAEENAALAAALTGYSRRSGPDDFSSLTGFLKAFPSSPWRVALLTNLGLEAIRTGHWSQALEAWNGAWALAKDAGDAAGRAVAGRAAGELAGLYARLGRMAELEALLKSVEGRVFTGPATERLHEAREGLWTMKNDPGIAFRCGPLALHRIQLAADPGNARHDLVHRSVSTRDGFSLPQVAELSREMGLDCRMAFREPGAEVAVPAVVHWRVGHYGALVRREGERFLVQDPTFRSDVWVTRAALDAEASGYFLVPASTVAPEAGWREVGEKEGASVWGKGNVGGPDPGGGGGGPKPPKPCDGGGGGGGGGGPRGMAAPAVDLLFVSLGLADEPVGYAPPVGPEVRFTAQYNHREASQPASFTYSNLGPKWTFDWLSYITDDPSNPHADVQYYRRGGFVRFFTGFNAANQSFALQPLDLTKLTRTSPSSYEMLSGDGSKMTFSQSDGSAGTARRIFLKELADPSGNTVTLTYDSLFRVIAITDAIGQVTALSYLYPPDPYKITKVTDPFGRFAAFDYDAAGRLVKITDVIGLSSRFVYEGESDFINALITPYGTTSFTRGESGTTRSLEVLYPDGNRERTEFNQSTTLGVPNSEAVTPAGVALRNEFLFYRNTYFWSKAAFAAGALDYTKAKIYHWLHTANPASAARMLESEKEPLENRVWYDYPGQNGNPIVAGSISQPSHAGRVLDDGSTQLYSYEYNAFGKVTKTVDPAGRTFSYTYSPDGIDLLEVCMTRNGANELFSRTTWNSRHLPLTVTDAAGQAVTYTYNTRGQMLTVTNAKGETTTFGYDAKGRRISSDGPLPGTVDQETWTFDAAGRVRTRTNESGYTLTFDHDALDRLTRITFPDGTYNERIYTRLDHTLLRDRAGRTTAFEYNPGRQMTKRTDPLGRVTLFQWCDCGKLSSLTDPMGRTTSWLHDLQGRRTAKVYADGSRISYHYEGATSRLHLRINERDQGTQYEYNPDNSLSGISYTDDLTPDARFTYDPEYMRMASMTDGTGTTLYTYLRISEMPTLGAGLPASVDGPLPNDTITFTYDQLGRRTSTAVNGVISSQTYDSAGRPLESNNALGTFENTYEGGSSRIAARSLLNGQATVFKYSDSLHDFHLRSISNKTEAGTVSEFTYDYNAPTRRIIAWTQQQGAQGPVVFDLSYDDADQLTGASATGEESGAVEFKYSYDPAGNRLTKQVGQTLQTFSYNALNELTSTQVDTRPPAAYRWDVEQRLISVNAGNEITTFTYDGLGRRVGIRRTVDGSEVSHRRFVWDGAEIAEERDASGTVVKRFFPEGVRVEAGPSEGDYFYTRDHLGSVRELIDSTGNVRARYSYDPFGRRTRVSGDIEVDFGFAGMFWSAETGLYLTWFRAYDPHIARWLSRDPLPDAEASEGPNLYAYVGNRPTDRRDPLGLCCEEEEKAVESAREALEDFLVELGIRKDRRDRRQGFFCSLPLSPLCVLALAARKGVEANEDEQTNDLIDAMVRANRALEKCQRKPCNPSGPTSCPESPEAGPRNR